MTGAERDAEWARNFVRWAIEDLGGVPPARETREAHVRPQPASGSRGRPRRAAPYEHLLGQLPDAEIAIRFGEQPTAVASLRWRRGIAPPAGVKRGPKPGAR